MEDHLADTLFTAKAMSVFTDISSQEETEKIPITCNSYSCWLATVSAFDRLAGCLTRQTAPLLLKAID